MCKTGDYNAKDSFGSKGNTHKNIKKANLQEIQLEIYNQGCDQDTVIEKYKVKSRKIRKHQ